MIALLPIAQGVIERGLIYSLVVIGIYITSRIIRFDDLTVEGSFGIGGAVTAACLVNNINFWFSLPLVLLAGALTGLATGLLHTKLKLNNLISGIIVTTGLFSLCLKIGSANTMVPATLSLFNTVQAWYILVPLACILVLALRWLLTTEIGFLLRAVGSNPRMLTNIGKDIDTYKMLGIGISNMITALAGSLLVHYVGYFSIWASVGTLIFALTGLILAQLISAGCGINLILGAIAYQAVIAATFEFDIDPVWQKLITALLLVALFSVRNSTISATVTR
ncbi:MAG TPA: hypothetical protein VLG71_00015 [Candidatus Limnocylindria bacterium]|nr:hypothetical protein [Candidatus Limnocylindria bacterium]